MNKAVHACVLLVLAAVAGCAPWGSVRRVDFGETKPLADAFSASCGLASAKTLAVLLKNLDIDAIVAADPDVVVVDWMSGVNACGEMDAAQVKRLHFRAGGDRLVLARLDIGHPDNVRVVFEPERPDGTCVPAVMIPLSPSIGDEAAISIDDPLWKKALCDGPDSQIARIVGLGFDGILVEGLGVVTGATDVAGRTAGLLQAVSEAARKLNPDFLVVPVNPGFGDAPPDVSISGVAFIGGLFADGYVLPAADLVPALEKMNRFRAAGIPVLSVEFIEDGIQKSHYEAVCRDMGFLCYPGIPAFNHLEPLIWSGNGAACSR